MNARTPAEGEAGFLSRWSRRKAQARHGEPVAEPAPAPSEPPAHHGPPPTAPAPAVVTQPVQPAPASTPDTAAAETTPPAAPTLADTAALNAQSDFTPFVARGVEPEVRNAALKKLFADPHFNVMDGLDTYIDDYGRPDPLPASMLKKMAQAHFLGLFTDETAPPVAAAPEPSPAPHEDPDLRLQPDDAAGRPGPEPSPGGDAGRQP
jgi:hypothetical protein